MRDHAREQCREQTKYEWLVMRWQNKGEAEKNKNRKRKQKGRNEEKSGLAHNF